jgi:hypothetical protein
VNDHRDLKMFVRPGRDLALWGLDDKSMPIGLVTPWRDDVGEEANVQAIRDLGSHIRFDLQEPEVRAALIASGHKNLPLEMDSTFVYGTDDRGPSAYLLLFCRQVTRERSTALIRQECRRVVKQYQQPGHVEWDGGLAMLFDRDGGEAKVLRAFDGTVECLDEWFGTIRQGFKAEGVFERNFSFVQMRWHQTQPREGEA